MMNRYDSYKDSGVDWIGRVPETWEIKRFKNLFYEKKSTKNPSLNCGSISFGEVVYKDDESILESTKESYQEVLRGEFLVNPLNLNYDLKSLRIGLSKIDVVVSQGYIVLNIYDEQNPEYYRYLLHIFDVKHLKSLGQGVRQTISFTHLKGETLINPPLNEQQQIVEYLDNKTSSIDSLIQSKEKKIELLKEKRTSLINQVVTKGLNPDVEMKDSGVEWIGEIPRGWGVLRSKYIYGNRVDKNHPDEPLLSVTHNQSVVKRDDLENRVWNPESDVSSYKLVKPDDFVISLRSFEGGIELSEIQGIVSPVYSVMFRKREIDNLYFKYLLKSHLFVTELNKITTGIRQGKNISFDDFSNVFLPIPPIGEQCEIGQYISDGTKLIDEIISSEQKKIELLKEYKQSLISEVVTGKRKVVD